MNKYSTNYEKECRYMRKCVTLDDHPKIKGYNFDKPINITNFLESFYQTGFQATNLGLGVNIVNKMIDNKAKIIISMTGNVISSGLREIITFLVKNKLVHSIITSAAGVEEDLIKCFKPFVVGDFDVPGKVLFDNGVGRIGNIFAPFDRYLYFEKFFDPFLEEIKNKKLTVSEFIRELGLKIDNKESYLYWAAKNNIPVFCPAIQDGSIGDLFYFFKKKNPDFTLDFIKDTNKFVDFCTNEQGKLGAIILGGGTPKHFLLNSNILREGLDYAVYLTTAQEFDGSDSGGNQEEAKTWAKIKCDAPTAKIKADFTLTFPLLIADTFGKKKN